MLPTAMSSELTTTPSLQSALEARRLNNFGVARLLAAIVVVLTHSYPLSGAQPSALGRAVLYDPYPYVGNYPVALFFVISGFLVTQSFLSGRQSTARFVAARVLRLYPALVAGVVLSLLLGTLCNALPIQETVASEHFREYLWKNATAYAFIPLLPGAFPGNPAPGGPNGSLWSLPLEVRMYLWVGLLGAAGLLRERRWGVAMLSAAVVLLLLASPPPAWLWHETHTLFAISFMIGMLAFLLRGRLRLSIVASLVLAAIFVGIARLAGPVPAHGFFTLCLPYWLLVVACHPALPAVRLPGDYSYGIYVYSFPIQQTIAWLFPDLEPWLYLSVTFTLIGVAAFVSWHFLEQRFLRLKPPA
jgi:peptidoglycan/LPS O-acetylase OafA/YrhL